MKLFKEIEEIINNRNIDDIKTKEMVSQKINDVLFNGENIIQCTNIPFVLHDVIQLDYENIDMIISIYNDGRMEFDKINTVSETITRVKKETFVRKAKRFNELYN